MSQQRASIEETEIVAGHVGALTAELDAWPASRAAMLTGVDSLGDLARPEPERREGAPVGFVGGERSSTARLGHAPSHTRPASRAPLEGASVLELPSPRERRFAQGPASSSGMGPTLGAARAVLQAWRIFGLVSIGSSGVSGSARRMRAQAPSASARSSSAT